MTCCAAGNGSPQPAAPTSGHATRRPPPSKIAKIRQLINRINGDITGLAPHERARIDEAVAVVRKHRAVVSLGMLRLRQAAPQ